MSTITFDTIKNNETIRTYIQKADEVLTSLNYTEHSFAHVTRVAEHAGWILTELGYDTHAIELAKIAGYMHDIGNVINRIDHAQSGAVMAFRLLDNLGADAADIAVIISAIGNHDESTAFPVNEVAAALIIADKSDVRYTRVRNASDAKNDIHDRVNYAVKKSSLEFNKEHSVLNLILEIDTDECHIMDYFEIFTSRMVLCKKACQKLNIAFGLIINGQQIL